jgi:hypothetical protein
LITAAGLDDESSDYERRHRGGCTSKTTSTL